MLTIGREIVDAIVAHARRDHPDEACGIVAGPIGSDLPLRHVPMDNAERSPTFYRFDSTEQLRVWNEMDDRDEEPIVIYHSHTATEAAPSPTDVAIAGYPDSHYLLVSTREPESAEIRSFRIVDRTVTEEPVRIVDASVDPAAVTTYMFGQSPTTVDYECSA
ncbi:MAG: peptidase [Actinobacteria bacterium 13_2_20CM_2_71_6]|nr:MAG: peptidase [Actinobacteria bacterium 13_2_20CM_2_71_6]